jgi:hypothetical protein
MRGKKNRNLIRRLNFCFLLSAFCLCTLNGCDKETTLRNRWNLQKVYINGEQVTNSTEYNLLPYYTNYYFYYENSLNVSTRAKGEATESADGWYKLQSKSTLQMRFTILDKRYNITAKIKKMTKKEMHLEYTANGNKYLLKLFTNG